MHKRVIVTLLILVLSVTSFSQDKPQKPTEDQTVRISTELVQIDVVVVDKNGRVVRGLTKDDFTLSDKGKRQQISFFEFVEAGRGEQPVAGRPADKQPAISPQGLSDADVKRIFAFVVDDLTIRFEDMTYLRQMLMNFVNNQMQPTDLVAIIRTVGGKGLLQQFTTDKDLLRRSINSLTVGTHPFRVFNNPAAQRVTASDLQPAGGAPSTPDERNTGILDTSGESIDIDDPQEDSNRTQRAVMTLSNAGFVIEGLKQLPGRKSLVLISGGIPTISFQPNSSVSFITHFLNQLVDKATRAGVAIHTMDMRGLQAHSAVPSFSETEAKSAMGAGAQPGFGRRAVDESLAIRPNFNTLDAHQGLRRLSADTGGLAVLNKNDFNAALAKIVDASEGYYLLAYTPSDAKFDGDFRNVEVKVKGDYKVYSRRGYFAREDKALTAAPVTKQDQLLVAVKSPLARRDIEIDAMILQKSVSPKQSAIDIHLQIDAKKLQFTQQDDKHHANFDVVGFVFDELGVLRGGFSDTITTGMTGEELKRASEGGFLYSANTTLAPGPYQVRLAVRDNKTGNIGTLSRFLEVPDLSKGRLSASSLLIGAVPQNDMKATTPTPITANRQISRKQDLRYAVVIYNPKLKDGKPQVRTQLIISQNGQVIFKEEEQGVAASQGNAAQIVKVGQLGLGGVKAGRYTLTMVITDPLADKKAQSISRSMDFVVVN